MAAEISQLADRRDAMKKEKKARLKELKNKRKRLGRLKKKAAALSDKDLLDIVKSRHLKITESAPADNEPRREKD